MRIDDMLPEKWRGLAAGADHVDVKIGEGAVSVLEAAAGIMSYRPRWVELLWWMRAGLVRVLGLGRQREVPRTRYTADTLPAEPGGRLGFFSVFDTDRESFWMVQGRESHLEAVLAVFATPLPGGPGRNRIHAATVVRYRSGIGPIYFNLIRPFHHLVVTRALRRALAGNGRRS